MQEVFFINKIISLVFGMIIFSILAGYVKTFGKKKTGLYSDFFYHDTTHFIWVVSKGVDIKCKIRVHKRNKEATRRI